MPVTKSRTAFYDIENLDQAGTTGFLFRDDDSAPEGKLYTTTTTEDNFPTLIRQTNMVSHLLLHCCADTILTFLSPFVFPQNLTTASAV